LAGDRRIILVEPRRLAARAAARRMAQERGGAVGEEVGYQVRFERRWGPRSRIVSVTPGILLRLLLDDPYLETAEVVIFDEYHERSLESDLALGLVRLVQQTVRADLRIVVMSATLATETVAKYLGDCPVISGGGQPYAVEILYEPRADASRGRLPRLGPWVVYSTVRTAICSSFWLASARSG
jgi:ATP-dependent helicase HrpB